MYHLLSIIRKKFRQISWGRVAAISTFFIVSTCFADENSDFMEMIIQGMNLIFAMVTALLTPAVILAGWLLTPDWTMGDFFGLRPYFINVWVLVSNLVYIAFALILLFLAVMQIFGSESSEYTFKKKLPQFLVGILMVPFTWLIVSWTLSFANQATAAVLSVPMGAIAALESSDSASSDKKGLFHDRVIPRKFFISNIGNNSTTDCTTTGGAESCISAAEFVANNQSGPFFIMMIYAYDIFRIQSADLAKLNSEKCGTKLDAKDCIKQLTNVVISFGTGLIITLFFGILTIALCWVLLMRAFKLWIYVMFSPLFGLAYFTGEGFSGPLHSGGGDSHGGSSGLSEVSFVGFFKLAMVPVMVSAVLSFGLLFVGVINQTFSPTHMNKESSGSYCTPLEGYMVRYCITPNGSSSDDATSQLIIGNPKNDKSKEYTITFEFGNTFSGFIGEDSKSIIKSGEGIVDSIQSVFAHVLLTLISLVIIWMGVAAAVKHDKVTEAAFAPFAKLGESVGHFVQHIPSYIPTPHPSFAAITPAFAEKLSEKMRTSVDNTVEASTARSMADILGSEETRRSSQLAQNINNPDSVDKFINQLAGTKAGVRDSNTILKDIKSTLQSLPTALNLQGAELTSFNALNSQLQKASSREEQARILSDPNNKVHVDALKNNSRVTNLFEQIQSPVPTSSSSTSSNSTGLSDTDKLNKGTVEAGGTLKHPPLNSAQRKAVTDSFKDNDSIERMKAPEIKKKLLDLGIPKNEVDEISDTDDQKAKNVARSLRSSAN